MDDQLETKTLQRLGHHEYGILKSRNVFSIAWSIDPQEGIAKCHSQIAYFDHTFIAT